MYINVIINGCIRISRIIYLQARVMSAWSQASLPNILVFINYHAKRALARVTAAHTSAASAHRATRFILKLN